MPPNIIVFYVDGTSVNGEQSHSTPWPTYADALAAAQAYADALNAQYHAAHFHDDPDGTYTTPTPDLDVVHVDTRAGVESSDYPSPPIAIPVGAVWESMGDGTEWNGQP